MWHKVIEWGNGFQEKYGEGSPADLDWGKLVILGLCIYIAIQVS